MARKLFYAAVCTLVFSFTAFTQETTAGIQGVVKDASGAVISKATVDVSSNTLIGGKSLTTDSSGYYHFTNLPPGQYTLSVNAPGFRRYQQTNILLETGHLPTVDVTLAVGGATETVEVSSEAELIDLTQSKVQTNITNDILTNVPKGLSYQSVIQFAPGARTEPLDSNNTTGAGIGHNDNGFQISGATNSENSYLIEGQETASPFDGQSKANVPMAFIDQVQVKTNGFEAEYGGALGGVVNVIQKRGTNEWHGSAFMMFIGDQLNAAPNRTLIRNPQVSANAGGAVRLDQPSENYQPLKDHYQYLIPGFTLGGPLLKNRLSAFVSFQPELDSIWRTVNFAPTAPQPGVHTIKQMQDTYYTNARLDYLLTQKVRLFAAWTYGYSRLQGSALPQADSAYGQFNSDASNPLANYAYSQAVRYPNSVYNFGGDVTLNEHMVATTRFGWFKFDNGATTGTPVGIRYRYIDSNYPYASNAPALAGTTALNGTALPAQFQHNTGFSNIGANTATIFDAWKDYNFNQDFSYFVTGAGTHTFKVGYGFRKGENDILSGYNSADVYVAYNHEYFPNTTGGVTNCNAIIAQNQASYGKPGGTPGTSCQGLWGTVNLRELGTTGKVGGLNHSIYFQDAWTVRPRLTLNLGVRLDKENLPSYNTLPGFEGIDFGWGQKIAPRLGAAWDVLGNGKLKAFGSYGKFFDIMKFQLPRGSFGGDYWHDCVYALDTPDYTQIIPTRDANGHYCPLGGGGAQAVGNFPSGGLRFIENVDYRQPANDPTSFETLGATGLVDPNLNPMEQHQMVLGSDWEITPTLGLETTYTRVRLDKTIEDAGVLTPNGEQYYIVNPGSGVNTTMSTALCTGCPPNPSAQRRYDAIDFRLLRRASRGVNGMVSYTWSRLYGNYSGLTATDISDSQGRNGANTDRAFDEPFMSFDAHGRPIDGPLATDRPNTFKAFGYYPLHWLNMTTDLGIYQYVYQGTPLSSYTSVNPGGAPVFLEGRGKFVQLTRDPTTGNFIAGAISNARTPIFANTDFSLAHEFHVSRTSERLHLRLEANISNIFNQHSPLVISQNMVRTGSITPAPCGTNCPAPGVTGSDYSVLEKNGYDYIGALNSGALTLSSLYGQAAQWQTPRNMRFGLTFKF